MRIVLLGCGKQKASKATIAKHLYTGSLFRARLKYVRANEPDKWFIISAKGGLMTPNQWVQPYDKTMQNLNPMARAAWHAYVAASLTDHLPDMTQAELKRTEIEILAGAYYYTPLDKILEAMGFLVTVPTRGMGQGEQMRFLTQA